MSKHKEFSLQIPRFYLQNRSAANFSVLEFQLSFYRKF